MCDRHSGGGRSGEQGEKGERGGGWKWVMRDSWCESSVSCKQHLTHALSAFQLQGGHVCVCARVTGGGERGGGADRGREGKGEDGGGMFSESSVSCQTVLKTANFSLNIPRHAVRFSQMARKKRPGGGEGRGVGGRGDIHINVSGLTESSECENFSL